MLDKLTLPGGIGKDTLISLGALLTIAQANAEDYGEPVSSQPCPEQFFHLPLPGDARLCQLFADTLPASLTLHSQSTPTDTYAYFVEQLGSPELEQTHQGRRMLQYQQAQKIIVISADGVGTQVDMLAKAE